jgi:phospholipid/cholesterol/gamma-HCH transport system permease protein
VLALSGDWVLAQKPPLMEEADKGLRAGLEVTSVVFDTKGLTRWDSCLLTFLWKVTERCSQENIRVDRGGLPLGAQRLLTLASAVPEREGTRKEDTRERFLERVGSWVFRVWGTVDETVGFVGEAFVAFAKLLVGKANFRRSDLILLLQECGAQAFPIVSLISVLVGVILGFVGAIQLRMFGAQIFVADIVGIAMVRIMGAVMTGIIMAGRTGAAFAAQIGTMQVNEEIDALRTLGISPFEFIVLPRMVALIVMMPLLCLYADVMGIVGGIVIGVGVLDLNLVEYLNRTREAVTMTYVWVGLFHSAVFGVLVALSGCLRGMQSGRSASSVGEAATSAVVTGIVAIVVATAIITFLCDVLGI